MKPSDLGGRPGATPIDIGQLLDLGPFTGAQRLIVALAALSILMDGFDGQLIGYAIPSILKDWGVTKAAFVPVVAAGLIGMGIGSASAGLFADRFGRRWAVIASVLVFGAATSCIGFAQDIFGLAALRFLAGLGIGGALPSSTTLSAEFTPARIRTMAVTFTIVCVPLGGMLAGVFAGAVLPLYGWRGLFQVGGLVAIAFGIVLILTLPESPRFLTRRSQRWPELRRLMGRISRIVADDAGFFDSAEQNTAQTQGFAQLFSHGRALDTVAIWCAFFMCLLSVYSAFSWLPTMLNSAGLSVAVAGAGLTFYNLGGVIGALGCAVAMTRFGSRGPMLVCCLGAALSAAALVSVDGHRNTNLLLLGLGVHGVFVNAVQSTLYSLCAFVYPTEIRATGTASALAFGRLGAILSAFTGAAVINAGGATAFLGMLCVAMLLVFLALALVTRHVAPARRGVASPPAG